MSDVVKLCQYYIALHCPNVILHYIALSYITLHYITLHYITSANAFTLSPNALRMLRPVLPCHSQFNVTHD